MKPFDIINSINNKTGIEWLEVAGDYLPYITNLSYSFGMQTVLLANEMNKNHFIPIEWQFDFYKNSVRKGTKNTWIKGSKESEESLEYIMIYYNVSKTKAKEIETLMSPDRIEELLKKYNKNKG